MATSISSDKQFPDLAGMETAPSGAESIPRALAARAVRRPVKLVVKRQQMFTFAWTSSLHRAACRARRHTRGPIDCDRS